jgi:hypothetical protein
MNNINNEKEVTKGKLIEIKTNTVRKEVVNILSDLLKRAESGEIIGIAAAIMCRAKEAERVVSGVVMEDPMSIVGILEFLKHDIMCHVEDEYEYIDPEVDPTG